MGDTLVPLMNLFPHLCEDKIDETEAEFRKIRFQTYIDIPKNIECFWSKMFELKNMLDEFMFLNLKVFVGVLLSLPHSSAVAERVFSQLNNIKTKNKNSLKTSTINAILMAKHIVLTCLSFYEWKPPNELIFKYKL